MPGAQAHGGRRSSGYVSCFSSLDPSVFGVLVNVFGRDNRIQLSNYSGKTVVVLGYEGEPYLGFTRAGSTRTCARPTTYLNRVRAGRPCPRRPTRGAAPRWQKVAARARPSRGTTTGSAGWARSRRPSVASGAGRLASRSSAGAFPRPPAASAFAIKGFLGWAPPPGRRQDDDGRVLRWRARGAAAAAWRSSPRSRWA